MFERRSFLPYGKQYLAYREYRAVRRVLKSRFLTQGPEVERFEAALKKATGAPYAVAVANGTAALNLAVRAVKILYKLKDRALALTSPNTFVASSNALLYNNLTPLFCDIETATGNLDLPELEALLQSQNDLGEPIELLLPVHFAGEPVDMARVWQLAQEYKAPSKECSQTSSTENSAAEQPWPSIPIIEDAAHALGSLYKNEDSLYKNEDSLRENSLSVGSCAYSDACCFSFHPVKTVTTAEGGAITCKDPQLHQLLVMLRSHGIHRQNSQNWQNLKENCRPDDIRQGNPPWYYEMQHLGENARLSDVHAAIGVVQMKRLKSFAAKRRHLAQRYNVAFAGLQWLTVPSLSEGTCPHIYVVQLNFGYLRLSRSAVMRELEAQKIGTQVHYIPVPMQPYYRGLGYDMKTLKNTENYYCGALSLPLYPFLRPKEQQHIIHCVHQLEKLADSP